MLTIPPQAAFVCSRGSPTGTNSRGLDNSVVTHSDPSVPHVVGGIAPPVQALLTPNVLDRSPRGGIVPSPPELFLQRGEEELRLPNARFPEQALACPSPLGLGEFVLEPLPEAPSTCKPLDLTKQGPQRQISWLQGIHIHTPNSHRSFEDGERLLWPEGQDGVSHSLGWNLTVFVSMTMINIMLSMIKL